VSFTDLVGTWQYLGTLTPAFNTWQRFSTPVNSANSLIRLTYYGEFNRIASKGFLRPVYTTPDLIYGRWLRFFPKSEREVFSSAIPQELLYVSDTITRYFEVSKRPKGYPTYYSIRDPNWSVAVESLEVVNLTTEQQAILAQANQIESLTNAIKGLLSS
jgi:hypothetical protein